ncbi:hypothetical protein JXM67_02915 [candidate division WOR-3 bacterium]|nr:hypothetical protein [candidate division WOR-3 bacterium]
MKDIATHDKGITPVRIKSWLEECYKQSDIEKIHKKLSPEAYKMLTSPVGNNWYPVELTREVYNTVTDVLGKRNPRVLIDYGYYSAQHSITGVLRFLMKLVDTNKIAKRMGAFWKFYHNGGKTTAGEVVEEGGRKKRTISYYGYDAGRYGCLVFEGYARALTEKAGGKNVTIVKKKCIYKGDDCCSWEVSWE